MESNGFILVQFRIYRPISLRETALADIRNSADGSLTRHPHTTTVSCASVLYERLLRNLSADIVGSLVVGMGSSKATTVDHEEYDVSITSSVKTIRRGTEWFSCLSVLLAEMSVQTYFTRAPLGLPRRSPVGMKTLGRIVQSPTPSNSSHCRVSNVKTSGPVLPDSHSAA